ncbi:amine oxidase [Polyplosphaeria fusca]|uniref:Amine oxidase n=1 Tax=Polyplosphaeria fusca TaxID=682080 RepID=A0A9P4QQ15_9PLEO|nr:amine oxidase [Polyplosphaeria fusca]
MDQRTHIPNNRRRRDSLTMSRIDQDLSSSPHQETYLEANGDVPMIRRAASAAGRIPHVCVVGAGTAGLRCADVLLQHGVKVTILEGRNRVGGRLCQSDALGHRVDLYSTRGPNWIHGTENNPILDLVKQTNTVTMNFDGRQSVFDRLGNHMDDKESAENTGMVWEIIEQAMQYSNDQSATIPAEQSLFDYFEEKVKEMIPAELENDQKVEARRKTILDMAEEWGAFVGSPVQTQSLKFFWMEECIDGENLFVAETYHKVLAKMAEPVQRGADIRFEHKVTKVVSNGTEDEPSVTVELDGRESMVFDEVVMTTPLGWLKQNLDAFVPPLPKRLTQAINSIGYGHLDKVYITFPTAFWDSPTTTSPHPTNPEHTLTHPVKATTAPLHPAPISSPPPHYPSFTLFTSPHYAYPTNPHHWNQEAVNLASLPAGTAHPTLLFYTFGPTSLSLARMLSHHPSPSHPAAQAALTTFFEAYFSLLPNYVRDSPSCMPTAVLATAWANDELAGHGSYSNFQVGLEKGGEDVEVMRRGVPERGVWVAGEHSAPFVALGTVTGAWWAGEGVARRICGVYGRGKMGGEGV